MVEERDENLQAADGMNESSETQNNSVENEQQEVQVSVEETVEKSEDDHVKLLSEKSVEEVVDEIEQQVASESEEDKVTHETQQEDEHIPLLSYKDFEIPALLNEAKSLLERFPVQKIKKHFEDIKSAFEDKVYQLTQAFKEAHPDADEVDLNIPEIKELKFVFKDYKNKL